MAAMHCLSAQCIVVDIVPLRRFNRTIADETHHETNNVTEQLRPFNRTMADASLEPFVEIPLNRDSAFQIPKKQSDLVYNSEQSVGSRKQQNDSVCNAGRNEGSKLKTNRICCMI
jgi:hypothetical protein